MLTLADVRIDNDAATDRLAAYAWDHHATVRYYDYGGETDREPVGSDGVVLADMARLLIINAGLRANDVAHLLEPVDPALWAAVPVDADFRTLPDDPRRDPLYHALVALYDGYHQRPNIKATKATKLLHLKRPGAVPIIDSVAVHAYTEIARRLASEVGEAEPMYWAAVWRDARRNAEPLASIRADLAERDPVEALVARLPLLRLHDILVWSTFHQSAGVAAE